MKNNKIKIEKFYFSSPTLKFFNVCIAKISLKVKNRGASNHKHLYAHLHACNTKIPCKRISQVQNLKQQKEEKKNKKYLTTVILLVCPWRYALPMACCSFDFPSPPCIGSFGKKKRKVKKGPVFFCGECFFFFSDF